MALLVPCGYSGLLRDAYKDERSGVGMSDTALAVRDAAASLTAFPRRSVGTMSLYSLRTLYLQMVEGAPLRRFTQFGRCGFIRGKKERGIHLLFYPVRQSPPHS